MSTVTAGNYPARNARAERKRFYGIQTGYYDSKQGKRIFGERYFASHEARVAAVAALIKEHGTESLGVSFVNRPASRKRGVRGRRASDKRCGGGR